MLHVNSFCFVFSLSTGVLIFGICWTIAGISKITFISVDSKRAGIISKLFDLAINIAKLFLGCLSIVARAKKSEEFIKSSINAAWNLLVLMTIQMIHGSVEAYQQVLYHVVYRLSISFGFLITAFIILYNIIVLQSYGRLLNQATQEQLNYD